MPRRPLSRASSSRTSPASPTGSTRRSRWRGSARSRSTSPTAACGTRSPTRARSASRSSRTRRATSRSPASGSAQPPASSCRASIPENPAIAGVSIVQIAEPWQGVGAVTRNAVVVAPGRLDRSATGTGLSARLAVLHARGLMGVGDAMTHASAIGSTFDGRIVAEARVGERAAIVPAIRGSAWITGVTQLYVDPDDPVPGGLPALGHLGRQRARQPGLTAGRGRPRPAAPPQDTGTVVSAKAACSGTSKRATPAAFVVTVPAIEFVPSPLAFQSASPNCVFAGSPPMLYSGDSGRDGVQVAPARVEPERASAARRPARVGGELLLGRVGRRPELPVVAQSHGSTWSTCQPRAVVWKQQVRARGSRGRAASPRRRGRSGSTSSR